MNVKKEDVEMTLLSDKSLREWFQPEDIKPDLKIQRQDSSTDNESVDFTQEYENEQLSDCEINTENLSEKETSSQSRDIEAKSSLLQDVTIQGAKTKTLNTKQKPRKGKGIIYAGRKLLKELCQGAPVASGEVTNMCRFRCTQCDKDIRNWRYVCDHFWAEHGQRISYLDVPKYISNKVSHICKICGEKTLCDASFLLWHLKKHDIKIGLYQKKYLFNVSNMLSDVVYSDKLIGNLCVYECEACKQRYSSKSVFTRHLTSMSHGSALNIGISLRKKVFHQCKLCNRSILCDKAVLSGHLRYTHGLTMELYCEQTGCTLERTRYFQLDFLKSLKESKKIRNACEFHCRICGITYNKVVNFRAHFTRHNIKPPGHLSDYLTRGSFYQCKKCGKHLLCDMYTIQHHMNVVHGTKLNINVAVITSHKREYEKLYAAFTRNIPTSSKVWKETAVPMTNIPLQDVTSKLGDLCVYSCPNCDDSEEFTSWHQLTVHSKVLHKHKIKFHPKHVLIARYHTCLVCPKAILCDHYFLRSHIYYNHKMGLSKYVAIFRRNGGEILPSFVEWRTKINKQE